MDVVLIRHARPRIADGICYGRLDVGLARPVSPAPARMLAAAGTPLPDRIVTSTATRAVDTARLLRDGLSGMLGDKEADMAADTRPVPPIETDDRLCELHFGAWEGLAWDAVPRAQLDQWAADLMGARPHGGESAAEAMLRVAAWADDLQSRAAADGVDRVHRADCLWMVGHAGPMRMLAAHWLGVPLAVTTHWRLGWGATCGFRLGGHAPVMRWWNREG